MKTFLGLLYTKAAFTLYLVQWFSISKWKNNEIYSHYHKPGTKSFSPINLRLKCLIWQLYWKRANSHHIKGSTVHFLNNLRFWYQNKSYLERDMGQNISITGKIKVKNLKFNLNYWSQLGYNLTPCYPIFSTFTS